MTDIDKHTPAGAWHTGLRKGMGQTAILGPSTFTPDSFIAETFNNEPDVNEANAAFIVLAVNSHAALLDALRRFGRHSGGCTAHIRWQNSMRRDDEADPPPAPTDGRCDCGLRAAIALATTGEAVEA